MIVSGMGLGLSIIQGLMRHAEGKGVVDMLHWLSTQKEGVEEVLDQMAIKMVEVLVMAQGRIGKVFLIKRGGNRTTEDVVGATVHTYTDSNINSTNFPLFPGLEENCELVAFQGWAVWDHDPSSREVGQELKRRGLVRPDYEDALRFDEMHQNEKGVFVFLHNPWIASGRRPRVLVVKHGEANHDLDLDLFDSTAWDRSYWFVGVRPRK